MDKTGIASSTYQTTIPHVGLAVDPRDVNWEAAWSGEWWVFKSGVAGSWPGRLFWYILPGSYLVHFFMLYFLVKFIIV